MPAALGQPGRGAMGARGLVTWLEAPAGQDEPAAPAAVPAHPVDVDADPLRALAVDVDALPLPGFDALLGHIALDVAVCDSSPQAPRQSAGQSVLVGDVRRVAARCSQPPVLAGAGFAVGGVLTMVHTSIRRAGIPRASTRDRDQQDNRTDRGADN